MKVSIITAAYNSAATIRDTLQSVSSQEYKNIEHIVVDGNSTDNTVAIVKSFPHVAQWISEKDKGLYDAINKGIMLATGDVIGILNSDDFFPGSDIISKIVDTFNQQDVDAVYGNVAFVHPGNLRKVVRLYSSKKFTPRKFAYGYMPAHPSFYVKRSVHENFGVYKTDYKIAADYELLMRLIYQHHISYAYIDETLVMMRTGGLSNKTLFSRYTLNKEIVKACKENGVNTNMAILSLKYFNKIFEFIKPAIKGSGK